MNQNQAQALIDAMKELRESIEKQSKRDGRKSEAKKKAKVEASVKKAGQKPSKQTTERAFAAASKATNTAATFAAAATDPRDVTGVGSSQALNGVIDSAFGSAAGSFLRNVTGLEAIQDKQNAISESVTGLIKRRAAMGLDTSTDLALAQEQRAIRINDRERRNLENFKRVSAFNQSGQGDPLYQLGIAVDTLKTKIERFIETFL